MVSIPGEADLVLRARQGDALAWEELVRACQEPVFRLAYLMLSDAAQAEDAAQEAFIRAYYAIEKYDPARPFLPWVMSIAANLARNRRRSSGRYLAAINRWIGNDLHKQAQSVEETSASRLKTQNLWEAIRKLPVEDQQIIYLRYFLEIPVEEASLILQIAPGTVKSRLHRALDKLRRVIEKHYPALVEEMIYE